MRCDELLPVRSVFCTRLDFRSGGSWPRSPHCFIHRRLRQTRLTRSLLKLRRQRRHRHPSTQALTRGFSTRRELLFNKPPTQFRRRNAVLLTTTHPNRPRPNGFTTTSYGIHGISQFDIESNNQCHSKTCFKDSGTYNCRDFPSQVLPLITVRFDTDAFPAEDHRFAARWTTCCPCF